jgi:hypothetical protein
MPIGQRRHGTAARREGTTRSAWLGTAAELRSCSHENLITVYARADKPLLTPVNIVCVMSCPAVHAPRHRLRLVRCSLFFSNRLGCLGSLLVSAIVKAVLILVLTLL